MIFSCKTDLAKALIGVYRMSVDTWTVIFTTVYFSLATF